MPVRSLRSSVLRWPDRAKVDDAVRRWTTGTAPQFSKVACEGYSRSQIRSNWAMKGNCAPWNIDAQGGCCPQRPLSRETA